MANNTDNAKKNSKVAKKDNFFVRVFKKIGKFFKDTVGEMKKVTWTKKSEVSKSTKLVIASVVLVGILILCIDTACSSLINYVAGLIG